MILNFLFLTLKVLSNVYVSDSISKEIGDNVRNIESNLIGKNKRLSKKMIRS